MRPECGRRRYHGSTGARRLTGEPAASTLAREMTPSLLAYIPSPPANGISIGPVRLHVYGLLIACGIGAAVWLSQRRWEKIGGSPGTMAALALWGVPGGLIGARLYSLITSWEVGHRRATGTGRSRSGRGGLGIWGGVIGGIALGARRRPPPPSALPTAHRLRRSGLRSRPGHRPLGQLLQPGALRPAVQPPLGGEDRQPRRARPYPPGSTFHRHFSTSASGT